MKKMKFSEWIRLAIADVKKVVRNPDYRFSLDKWHVPGKICLVCFAGSRMTGLGANINEDLYPSDFKEHAQLSALDSLRYGDIDDSLEHYYGISFGAHERDLLIPAYQYKWKYEGILSPYQRKKFYKDMLGFADALDKLGY